MTAEEIFKTMQDLIAEQFAIDAEEITLDSSFVDDLGADSVDLVELVMAMEEEFDVGEIDEEDLAGLKTVRDCVQWSGPPPAGPDAQRQSCPRTRNRLQHFRFRRWCRHLPDNARWRQSPYRHPDPV